MSKPVIDIIDRKILTILQTDAHATSEQLSEQVGTVAFALRPQGAESGATGVIKGYVAVIDQVKVGLPISVFASIKLERQREEELDRFASAVPRWPEVVDCYLMTGQRDYLLRIVVNDLEAYERSSRAS